MDTIPLNKNSVQGEKEEQKVLNYFGIKLCNGSKINCTKNLVQFGTKGLDWRSHKSDFLK